jgi:hypothetical protein
METFAQPKLGVTAGIGVVLVGGMPGNQMLWQSVDCGICLVITNYFNKGNAQSTQAATARA